MDITRLLRMVLGRFLRRGMDHLARGGKSPAEMTPADRARQQQTRQAQKRLRDAQRITRILRR